MTDERALADLLGEAPSTPDRRFRIDVFGRIAERSARRAARARALRQIFVFAAVGVVLAATQAAGVDWGWLRPVALAAAVLMLAWVFAAAVIQGPRLALTRSWTMLRAAF